MNERELADHLFDVARSRARGMGRYFGEGAGHDLLDLANQGAAGLVAFPAGPDRDAAIARAEDDLRRLIDLALAAARAIPGYPPDLLGEATYFPARMRFCPCRPFC
jgi:hypothetical protein